MSTRSANSMPMPFGIRIPNVDVQLITTTNIYPIVQIPDDDTTLVYAPHQAAYDLWRKELTRAGSKFSLLG